MTFESLVEGLAERAGLVGGLAADEDGVVHVEIDGFDVAFMEVPETERLVMWSNLGEMPFDDDGALTARMLRENFARRGREALSRDEAGHAFAHRFVPLAALGLDDFINGQLEEFLGLLSRWTGLVRGEDEEGSNGHE